MLYEEFTGRQQKSSNKKAILLMSLVGVVAVVGAVVLCQSHFATSAPVVSMNEVSETDALMYGAFNKWTTKYNKVYNLKEEEMYRFTVFKKNFAKVKAMTDEGRSYQLALNSFADLTTEEFEAHFLSSRFADEETNTGNEVYLNTDNLPDTIDWREHGAVTPMKSQGFCGSCWAFAAVAATEGHAFLKKGTLTRFSEQQLVDCSGDYGNMGCNGGFALWGQQYIADKGVEKEDVYPYKAVQGKCKYDEAQVVHNIEGVVEVTKQDPDQLAAALAERPVAVRVKADSSVFQFYSGGVIDSTACGTQPNHAITAVGYNSVAEKPFWIVKNSWGNGWGESGYVRILKESKKGAGICGIYQGPTYPK